MRSLTGRAFPARPAVLRGFRRGVSRAGHAYVLPDPDPAARVDGLVLGGLDDAALARLDAYEDAGRLYHRRAVVVDTDDGRVACDVYVGDAAALDVAG